MPIISKFSDINTSLIKLSEPWVNKSGGQTVFVTDLNDKKIVFTTPLCKAPFGISCMNNRYSISLNVPQNDEKTKDFSDFLSQLDLHILSTAKNCSQSWFKKDLSQSKITSMYNPNLKNKNENYPPVFRARFPTDPNGNFMGNIYDFNRNMINQSNITNGSMIEAIVELSGIYFIANDFGVSWKILQIKVNPNVPVKGYAFMDDSDSELSEAEPN